jgi:hypothetical protein
VDIKSEVEQNVDFGTILDFYEGNYDFIVRESTKLASLLRKHPDKSYEGDLAGNPQALKVFNLDEELNEIERNLEGALKNQDRMNDYLRDNLSDPPHEDYTNRFEELLIEMDNFYVKNVRPVLDEDVYEVKNIPEVLNT